MGNINRQAIVLIHGIGEQRPMDTLRSFVLGLGETKYYNKPDRVSGSLELRRYSLPSDRKRPITDCYEFYWAHHFVNGKLLETLRWGIALILRHPFWHWDKAMRPLVGAAQIGGGLFGLMLVFLIIQVIQTKAAMDVTLYLLIAFVTVLLIGTLISSSFVTARLADAARYLTPHPKNVAGRNLIRSEGLNLLRDLHQNGQYDRIILVGHSLGSVIGLDLLRLAWDDLRHPCPPDKFEQPAATTFEHWAEKVLNDPSLKNVDEFQKAQHQLWLENRKVGIPWLVTDFVTLGSPLTHASLLLDTASVKLKQRQREGEYPYCPPWTDERTLFFSGRYTSSAGNPRNVKVGMHNAPFGPTRWTNLYFPVKAGFLGDPVGGPVSAEFGPGVRDIAVRLSARGWRASFNQLLLRPHTRYWARDSKSTNVDRRSREQTDKATQTKDANVMLLHSLRL